MFPRMALGIVLAFVIAGLITVAQQSSLARRSADFTIDYSAALLIRESHPDAIYDRERLGPLMLRVSNGAIDPQLPFDAPLAMALPYVPLTLLPLEPAFRVWQGMTVLLLAAAILILARWIPLTARAPSVGILALLGFPATWALLAEGQSSALLLLGAALLIGAWRRGSLVLAAGGGLLLAMKPQYLPVYVILLALGRWWRGLAAAMLGGIVVALSPMAAGGITGLTAMISNALEPGQSYLRFSESLIGTLAPFAPRSMATLIGFALWGLVLIALTTLALRTPHPDPHPQGRRETHASSTLPARRRELSGRETSFALLATFAGVLFAPHALPYDLVLLAVPMWLATELSRRGEIPAPAPAGFAIAAAMVLDLGRPTISLAPLVMLGCLVIYAAIWVRRRNATALAQVA